MLGVIWSCACAHVAKKVRNVTNNTVLKLCDKSSLYMYFKKLGFSGFSHPVEQEIRIFFALKQIPHIGGHFKTLTFKIGGLEAEIFV